MEEIKRGQDYKIGLWRIKEVENGVWQNRNLKYFLNNKISDSDLIGQKAKAKNDLLEYEEIIYECTKDERNKNAKVSFKLPAKQIIIFRN